MLFTLHLIVYSAYSDAFLDGLPLEIFMFTSSCGKYWHNSRKQDITLVILLYSFLRYLLLQPASHLQSRRFGHSGLQERKRWLLLLWRCCLSLCTSKILTQHDSGSTMNDCTYRHTCTFVELVQQVHWEFPLGPTGVSGTVSHAVLKTSTRLVLLLSLLYAVDDGTGVINCLCWKNDLLKQQGKPSGCECAYVSSFRSSYKNRFVSMYHQIKFLIWTFVLS